jgi:transposase-like protein
MAWIASTNPAVRQRWRERVECYESSGVPMKEFCRREGFGRESLRRWRRWFREQGATERAAAPALVEVNVSPEPRVDPRDAMVVELAGGRRVHLEPGFDAAAVACLVATLERL